MPKQSTLRRDDPRYLGSWRAERLRIDYYPSEAAARIIKENANDRLGGPYPYTGILNWIIEDWESFRKRLSRFAEEEAVLRKLASKSALK